MALRGSFQLESDVEVEFTSMLFPSPPTTNSCTCGLPKNSVVRSFLLNTVVRSTHKVQSYTHGMHKFTGWKYHKGTARIDVTRTSRRHKVTAAFSKGITNDHIAMWTIKFSSFSILVRGVEKSHDFVLSCRHHGNYKYRKTTHRPRKWQTVRQPLRSINQIKAPQPKQENKPPNKDPSHETALHETMSWPLFMLLSKSPAPQADKLGGKLLQVSNQLAIKIQ